MAQGRQAVYDLLKNKTSWPPVVVPFGLDPWGWHGAQESYREVCHYAVEHCTLFPKVYPFNIPLFVGEGDIRLVTDSTREPDGTLIHHHELKGAARPLSMEEVCTPGDSSWKNRKRWIENDHDLDCFLDLKHLVPAKPDIGAVREKEKQVGERGLPYIETPDPFGTVSEMFSTDEFYIKLRTDTSRIIELLNVTSKRILHSIEELFSNTGCPYILRLIGAEMAVPPFLSRDDFIRFEGEFYRNIAKTAKKYDVLTAFHCHGPVRDIMDDIWNMGFNFIEPFEPPPRGDVTIAEALSCADGRGVVFGGIDDVIFNAGTMEDVEKAVECCLNDSRTTGSPYILSQSATPFHDPLSGEASRNIIKFMELGIKG